MKLIEESEEVSGSIISEEFYKRLFEASPTMIDLFKGVSSMKKQQYLLWSMLGTAVLKLDDSEFLKNVLQDLGERHKTYGVTKEHYAIFKQCFISTIILHYQQKPGCVDSEELRDSWDCVLDFLARVMLGELPCN